jgi:hypothetical protein
LLIPSKTTIPIVAVPLFRARWVCCRTQPKKLAREESVGTSRDRDRLNKLKEKTKTDPTHPANGMYLTGTGTGTGPGTGSGVHIQGWVRYLLHL